MLLVSGWFSFSKTIIPEAGSTFSSLQHADTLISSVDWGLGNAPWAKKKMFYAALRAQTKNERDSLIEQAEHEGFHFAETTKEIMDQQGRLHMLDPLESVDEWTQEFIRQRSENILALAWDNIATWLYA